MIGIAGIGTYLPETRRDAAELAGLTGIPAGVIEGKFGVRAVRVAGAGESAVDMAAAAAARALEGFEPAGLDLVVYCGSQHKEPPGPWSAATEVARRVGAVRASAFELNALCAGTPVSLKVVRGLFGEDPGLRSALVVGGGRETDLIDYANPRARFLTNFGSGMGALLLLRDHANPVLAAALVSDPSCAMDVYVRDGCLDVPDPGGMKERLDAVSLPNFMGVARQVLGAAGVDRPDFVALTHMKRSMHEAVLAGLGVPAEASCYLEDTGHMQSADQPLALERGLAAGRVRAGSTVLMLAAGTGYTWSAAAIRWGARP